MVAAGCTAGSVPVPAHPKDSRRCGRLEPFTASTHAAPSSNDAVRGPRAGCSLICSINSAPEELRTEPGPHRCGPQLTTPVPDETLPVVRPARPSAHLITVSQNPRHILGRAHAVGDDASLTEKLVSKADGGWNGTPSKVSADIPTVGCEWKTAFSDAHCGYVYPRGCSAVTFRARPPGRKISSAPPTRLKNHGTFLRETTGTTDLRPENHFTTFSRCRVYG